MRARICTFTASLLLLSCSNPKQVAPTPTASSLAVSCDVTGFSAIGQQGHCSARVTLSNATTQDAPSGTQWSSSDSTKVSVSPTGVITAVAPGSADIFALYSGLSGKQTIGVTIGCAFAVLPATVSFASGGGSQNVTVTASPAGCSPSAWTASSSNAALTVSPSSGSGSGTVTLTAAANSGSAQTWTATIAGQAVAATIAAAPPKPQRVLSLTLEDGEQLAGPFLGVVTGPNGFSCTENAPPTVCPKVTFEDGQTITLTVRLTVGLPDDTPIKSAVGCDSVTSSTCTLVMNRDRDVRIAVGCAVTCAPVEDAVAVDSESFPIGPERLGSRTSPRPLRRSSALREE